MIDFADRVKDGEGFDHLHIVRVEQFIHSQANKLKKLSRVSQMQKKSYGYKKSRKTKVHGNSCLENLYELAEGKKIRYVGRPAMSSTSEGDRTHIKQHKQS